MDPGSQIARGFGVGALAWVLFLGLGVGWCEWFEGVRGWIGCGVPVWVRLGMGLVSLGSV